MNFTALDTTTNLTNFLPQLREKGITHVFRYITHAGWVLKRAEAQAITRAGLKIIGNFEGRGASPDAFTHAQGLADGRFARSYMHSEFNAPPSAIMPFSTEAKFDKAFINNSIFPYFDGVIAAMNEQRDYPSYGIAAYSSGSVLTALLDTKRIKWAWLANAMGWEGSRAFLASGRHAVQQLTTVKNFLPGLEIDPDVLNPNFQGELGAFVVPNIPVEEPPPVNDHPLLKLGSRGDAVKLAQQLLGMADKETDGIFGPKTEQAVKDFQKTNGLVVDGKIGDKTWGALQIGRQGV